MKIKELLQKGFWTLLARSIGAVLMFLMTILFARWLGASDFGLFSLGLTIMTVLGILARWGTDQILLKQVGAHWETEPETAKGYTVGVIKLVLIISILFATFVVIFHGEIATTIFNKPEFAGVLFWFGLMILPFSINYTLAETYKGMGKPILSSYLQNVIPAFFAILLGSFLYYLNQSNLISISQAFAVGACMALLFSIALWRRIIRKMNTTTVSLKQVFKEGWPMLLITSGALVMAWSDMVILGIWGTSEELGIYSVASRTVMVMTLILVAMNSITAPRYSKLFSAGNGKGLAKLAQNSSKILVGIVLIPSAILLVFSEEIMSLFGPEFIIGAPILMVLVIGQFFNVACGSVGYLLTMTGHEKAFRNIILVTAVFNIILSIILVQQYGALGVAYATAISMVLWNIWALFMVKHKLGFWTFGFVRELSGDKSA